MKSVNKVILVGNAGKDPEIVTSNSGTKIAKFSLATNENYKDASGEWQDKTEWHNIVVFGKLADVVESYVRKGNQLYIEGKISTRKYEKDGQTKYFTEVVVNDLVLLGGKSSGSGQSEESVKAKSTPVAVTTPISDDDIPF